MKFIFNILKFFPPEAAHLIALHSLKMIYKIGLINFFFDIKIPSNTYSLDNLIFKNRLGVAAGLDKNGDYIDSLGALGFGFIEVGTVTPIAQTGNPKPRIFRLFKENAIINRLGFNNKGVDHLVKKLESRKYTGVVGVNIGANKNSQGDKRIQDYLECFTKVYELSDYITLNISSPNTPDLRNLHSKENISKLLSTISNERDSFKGTKPIFLKISPDESLDTIKEVVSSIKEYNFSGIIISNTTIDKSILEDKSYIDELGGLSGEPLFNKSTELIHLIREIDTEIPIIGVGGVIDKASFDKKLEVGADLIQIYTGFIIKGPDIISELLN